jgi:methylated-DNA-protein-cysteine methyltransferase-like protein
VTESVNDNSNNFYRRVGNTVAAIPPGRVASYGQIAELAGHRRGARLIGRALGRAPNRAELPWHRVLNAQGKISIPPGHTAHQEQIRRLIDESVCVKDGRVDMARYQWQPDLDELLWGLPSFDVEADGNGNCDG